MVAVHMRGSKRDKASPYVLQALRKAARHLPINGIVNLGRTLRAEVIEAARQLAAVLNAKGAPDE